MIYYKFFEILPNKIIESKTKILLLARNNKLIGVFLENQKSFPKIENNWVLNDKLFLFQKFEYELINFLSGNTNNFNILFEINGTNFQTKIWNELIKIPYGETSTYKKITSKITNLKAYRAVGTAISKNPLLFVIPCHRVINENGKLGGFAAGLTLKKKLLDLEKLNYLF